MDDLPAAAAAAASTPYKLGAFFGNADGEAQQQLVAFTKLMGIAPALFNAFTDFTAAPNEWVGNTSWFAGVCKNAPGYQPPNIPLIHLPTFSTNSGAPSTAQILENYSSGAYDTMIQAFVETWANAGYKAQEYRVGVEMNLSDGTYVYEGLQPAWIAAFQRISTVLRAAFKTYAVTGHVMWNPGCAGSQMSGDIRTAMWPGAEYVDVIGGDCYDSWANWAPNKADLEASVAGLDWKTAPYPTALEEYYNTLDDSSASGFPLPVMIAFAAEQKLPICVPECGCGAVPSDNPWFPRWLRHNFDAAVAAGVPVWYLSIWDSNADVPDLFTDGSKPQEAEAWAYYFGAGAAPPMPVPTPVPSHGASPADTQVNGTNGTIYDTAGNAWTINAAKQIEINGKVVTSSADVVTLFWDGSALEQLNGGGDWWTQPLDGSGGTALTAAPAGYKAPAPAPAPVAPVTSPAGTQLPPVPITTIYDTAGVAWTLPTVGGQIKRNGTVVASSADVVALFWDGKALSQLNAAGAWWTQPLDGSAGTKLTAAPAGYVA
jgi:hypothetical protein